ncbi:MAG: hypothetical protein JXP73_17500 [Deltaproteobacteria bacterium]|nr:hypothetical protein [Deltaproteobacteria bacterium]
MTRRCAYSAIACALVVGLGRPAHAADLPPPTVFDGAYQGLLVGAIAGAATGYMFSRSDTWDKSGGWKPVAYGTGIGALSGAVLGLTLGVVDMAQHKPHRNAYVMRDGLYGAGLGAVLGGIAGGMAAIYAKEFEYALLGASIGVLTGTVGGFAVGFVEGYRKYSATLAPVRQSDGSHAFVPALVGRF